MRAKLRCLCVLSAVFIGLLSNAVYADFIRLEKVIGPISDDLKSEIGSKTAIVAVRQVGRSALPWAAHEAISLELTIAARDREIDAIRAASDLRIETLGDPKAEFTAADAKRVKAIGRDLLIAGTLSGGGTPKLKISIWSAESTQPSWSKEYTIPAEALSLTANVPTFNKKVVEFCRSNFDKKVGGGECAQLATVALENVGAKRSGVYTWGREMDEREPVLPGDILQLELVKLKQGEFSRGFHHHTAVVEDVRPDG